VAARKNKFKKKQNQFTFTQLQSGFCVT